MRATRERWLMVFGILAAFVVAWLLRLSGIGDRTLIWDEAYHVSLALQPTPAAMLDAILHNPPSDPLYALFLRSWVAVAGTSDVALRLPSTLFGALTAAAAAWLGWELTRDRRVALATAAIVAVGPYLVEFGQEASLYALATLTTTLALAAGQRWLRTGSQCVAVVAVVIAIVACYCHYVVPATLGLAGLLALSPLGAPRVVSARAIGIVALIVVVAWLPWGAPMVVSWLSNANARTGLAQSVGLSELGGALSQYASGSGALLERIRPLQLIGLVAAGALIFRSWFVARSPQLRGIRVVLVTSAILLVLPWAVSVITGRWLFVAHMMLFILPAAAVAAAAGGLLPVSPRRTEEQRGLARGARMLGRRDLAALALGALLVAQVAGVVVDIQSPPHGNDGTREIVSSILGDAPEAPVFVSPAATQVVFAHYLSQPVYGLPQDVDLRDLYGLPGSDAGQAQSIARFDLLSRGHPSAWLVYTPTPGGGQPLIDWLRRTYVTNLVMHAQVGDLYRIDL